MEKGDFSGGKNSVGITISNKAVGKFIFNSCQRANFYLSNTLLEVFLA